MATTASSLGAITVVVASRLVRFQHGVIAAAFVGVQRPPRVDTGAFERQARRVFDPFDVLEAFAEANENGSAAR